MQKFFCSFLIFFWFPYSPCFSQMNAVPFKMESFTPGEVRLLPGSPFYKAMENNRTYLLSLDVDRLVAGIRKRNGLVPKGEVYGGWEKNGWGVSFGHYLSACALQFAYTRDPIFLERTKQLVHELKEMQDNTSDGWFLGGKDGLEKLTKGELMLNQPDESGQPWNFNNVGNFWYSAHKILAGLRDAYWYTSNKEALEVLNKLGDWMLSWSEKVNADLFQNMLDVEQGGMNEVVADLYSLTGNPNYLKLAKKFCHFTVLYPVSNGEDVLFSRHANDQIPGFIGASRIYELTGDKLMQLAAKNFWEMVIRDHTLVIGGNGCYERFGKPGEPSFRLDFSSAETCNSYNMLKLTRHLFNLTGDCRYLDYYERTLYNHILASQDPDMPGCVTYYTSLAPGSFKQYSTPTESFWCCVGTGMENHTKYTESIFTHNDNDLFVNLFIPSTLNWEKNDFQARLESDFTKSDTIKIKILKNNQFKGDLWIRKPSWTNTEISLQINGVSKKPVVKDGFLVVEKNLLPGDVIAVVFPKKLHLEMTPDQKYFGSILYGPFVLAGELGKADMPNDRVSDNRECRTIPFLKNIPEFTGPNDKLDQWIIRKDNSSLQFLAKPIGNKQPISLIPFYALHHQRTSVYWKIYSPTEFNYRKQSLTDEVLIGDETNENAHQLSGEKTSIAWHDFFLAKNTQCRTTATNGWFSYQLSINPDQKKYYLICKFWGDETPEHQFDILVDNVPVTTIKLNRHLPLTYVEDLIEIPANITSGKKKINVTFKAENGHVAGNLYALKITNDKNIR